MSNKEVAPDVEFEAMQTIFKVLDPLEPDSRERVLAYISDRFQLSTVRASRPNSAPGKAEENESAAEAGNKSASQRTFDTFAELF